MPNWKEIRQEWETTEITFKDLAEKHEVKDSTIRSRKNREKWQRNATRKQSNEARKEKAKQPIIKNEDLTDKQKLFCLHYLKYFNATKAYQKAYECAYTTAMVEGHRHLRNPKISAEIDRIKEEQINELKLDVRDVLQKYIDIAFSDIGDYVERSEDGYSVTVKHTEDMDTSIIDELSNTQNGIKLKLADKMKALDMLAKYTDLLSDSDRKQLDQEKIKAETDFTELRAKQIKGETKDTSLLDALIEGRKQFEQMMKDCEKNE